MRKGFTIIELLIVIAIIGILAVVSLSSYSETRQVAELNIETDTLISNLREYKGRSQNVIPDENDQVYCLGFKFNSQEDPQIEELKYQYENPFTLCDTTTNLQTERQALNQLSITEILLLESNGTSKIVNSLELLFYPPKGQSLVLVDGTKLQENNFQKIQIKTRLKERENKNYITILNSGVIQKELIPPTNEATE